MAQAEAPTLAELKRKVERDLWRRYRQGSLKDVYGDTFPEIV